MSSTRCVWIQYRNATGLELIGECVERPSESEVLIASELGDGLDAEDLGEHLVVTLGETGQGRRRTVEGFLADSCLRTLGRAPCPGRPMLPSPAPFSIESATALTRH